MSVIVKGMKMPKDCYYCDMSSFGVCNVVGRIWDIEKRPDWCPLVELPEKHGRLIDADILEKGLRHMAKYQHGEQQQGILGCCETIRLASAIIPAEEEPTIVEAEGD